MAKPITKIENDVLSSTLRCLAQAGANTEHADWIRGPGNAERLIKFIEERRSLALSEQKLLVTVPDLTPANLVAQVHDTLTLTDFNESYASWDFIRDERGKTYEVLVWKPGRVVTSDEVRKHFAALGADGNTAAFLVWIVKNDPKGWFVSIPSQDARLFQQAADFAAPGYYRGAGDRMLGFKFVDTEFHEDYCFIAFREVKPA